MFRTVVLNFYLLVVSAHAHAFFWSNSQGQKEATTPTPAVPTAHLAPAQDKYDQGLEREGSYSGHGGRDVQNGPSNDREVTGSGDPQNNEVLEREIFAARLRADILHKLGLETVPKVVANISAIPDILLTPEPGDYQGDSPADQQRRVPIRHLTKFATIAPECNPPDTGYSACLHINVTDMVPEMVGSALLYVYKRRSPVLGHTGRLDVLQLNCRKRKVLSREEVIVEEGWVKLNVKHTVQRWLHRSSNSPRGFQVRCATCDAVPIELTGNRRPFLIVRPPEPTTRHRHRRHSVACTPNYQGCCLETATFTFRELGLGFIVQPRSISPNRCRGSCDVRIEAGNIGQGLTEHARVIQALMDDHPACCAPDHLEPLSILYQNDDGYTIKQDMPDVIARSCGCH